MSSTSVSAILYAVDTTSMYAKYKSGTLSVTISTPSSLNTFTTSAPSLSTDAIQSTESSFVIPLTILSGHVSGAVVAFFYQTMAVNTLSLSGSSASIQDNGSSIGTCTINSVSLYTSCTLSSTPTTSLTLKLTSFPTPSASVSSTTNIY